jgi:hypothetical protein
MSMIYIHIIFEIPTSSGSIVITVKMEGKENIHTGAMLLLYTLQDSNLINNPCFLMICYYT